MTGIARQFGRGRSGEAAIKQLGHMLIAGDSALSTHDHADYAVIIALGGSSNIEAGSANITGFQTIDTLNVAYHAVVTMIGDASVTERLS